MFSSAAQCAVQVCLDLNLKRAAFDFMVRTVVRLLASNVVAPMSVSAVLAAIAASAPLVVRSENCRVERYRLSTSADNMPVYMRGSHAIQPAECLSYLFAKHVLFGLQMRHDLGGSLVFEHRVVSEPQAPVLATLTIVFDRSCVGPDNQVLTYYSVLCLTENDSTLSSSATTTTTTTTTAAATTSTTPTLAAPTTALPLSSPSSSWSRPQTTWRPTTSMFTAAVFAAEQRLASIYTKVGTHRFVEAVWGRLWAADGPSADEWILFVALQSEFSPELDSILLFDPQLQPLLVQLARLYQPLQAFVQQAFGASRARVIEFPPVSAEYENSSHLVVLHATAPHSAVLIRADPRQRRLLVYALTARHATPESELASARESTRELVEETVNVLCLFLWHRLTR